MTSLPEDKSAVQIKNPHRLFERTPESWLHIPHPSEDFDVDFKSMILWCASSGKVERYHRCEYFHMAPEPYGTKLPLPENEDQKKQKLLAQAFSLVEGDITCWRWLYRKLEDTESKLLLLNILAYRSLGWKYVPMPLDNPEFWRAMQTLKDLQSQSQSINSTDFADCSPYEMSRLDLRKIGYGVDLFSDAFGVFNEFIYPQYSYRGRQILISPNKGDYILDCGACFGGTSLYFAESVGPAGKVVSFEFFSKNVALFNENMRLNPTISPRVTLIQKPVWSRPDVTMSIEGSGPATHVHVHKKLKWWKRMERSPKAKRKDRTIQATTIDETVRKLRLPKVNYIKMDIEGSEMAALRGAVDTIKTFRPTLAICVYHGLSDFFSVPLFLEQFNLGYKYYLQHSTVHGDETVVFAKPDYAPDRLSTFTRKLPLWGSRIKNKSFIKRTRILKI